MNSNNNYNNKDENDIPVQSITESQKRVQMLKCGGHCATFEFAMELIPSAVAAYGRPVIGSHEDECPHSLSFEWQHMFWLFKINGDQISVVIDHDIKNVLTFYRGDLSEFIANFNCIPYGMPPIGDQSEFSINRER